MITSILPLAIGNAVRLFLTPPASARACILLRNRSGVFSGHDDATSVEAYRGSDETIVDATALANDTLYYWKVFYTADNATWTAGNVLGGTPTATYQDHSTDVMNALRERLEAGLKVECQRGNFQTELGYIQVYTAPPVMENGLRFPLVTLHLENEDAGDRLLGEGIAGDEFDTIGFELSDSEGWFANVRLQIIGWCLNGDERAELRRAIRRIIVANLTVFESYGWALPNLSQQDLDAISGEYSANIFQVMNTFSCMAPVRVGGNVDSVVDIKFEVTHV